MCFRPDDTQLTSGSGEDFECGNATASASFVVAHCFLRLVVKLSRPRPERVMRPRASAACRASYCVTSYCVREDTAVTA